MPSINFIRMDWRTSAGKISDNIGTIGGRRGFGWTGSNWAEIGHSMMKRHTKVWLSVAAVEDIADFIV